VVDEVRVLRLLRLATDDLAVLRDEGRPTKRDKPIRCGCGASSYTFVTAIEAVRRRRAAHLRIRGLGATAGHGSQ
jgi:hypothetical protein